MMKNILFDNLIHRKSNAHRLKNRWLSVSFIFCMFLCLSSCGLLNDCGDKLFGNTEASYRWDGTVTVYASECDKIHILSENPVKVPYGKEVSFSYEADDGYGLEELGENINITDNTITIDAVYEPTTLNLDARKLYSCDFTACNDNVELGNLKVSHENGTYLSGTKITLTATPLPDCTFLGYSLNGPATDNFICTEKNYSFKINDPTVIYANFKMQEYDVTLDLSEASGISVNKEKITVIAGHGAKFSLNLKPNVEIDSISDGAILSNGILSVDDVHKNTTIKLKAHRPSSYQFALVVNDSLGGTASADIPNGKHPTDTPITLRMDSVNAGYIFDGFSLNTSLSEGGTLLSTSNQTSFLLDNNMTVYANFIKKDDSSKLNIAKKKGKWTLIYRMNGGTNTLDKGKDYHVEYFANDFYWCPNTLPNRGQFTKNGYVLLGYNTKADGTGIFYGTGWNVIMPSDNNEITLYCVWVKASNEDDFVFSKGTISAYKGNDSFVVIPETIDGKKVTKISTGTFKGNQTIEKLLITRNVTEVESKIAVSCPRLTTLYCNDMVTAFKDDWYIDCPSYSSFCPLAARMPAYVNDSNWNATYGIKWELMMTVKKPKIMVLAGSNVAYGVNSRYITNSLNDVGYKYEVINFGTNYNTCAFFFIEACSHFMTKDDILLLAPEMNEQQWGRTKIETLLWEVFDSNYDAFSYVNAENYDKLYSSFGTHNKLSLKILSKNSNYEHHDKRITRYGDQDWNKVGTLSSTATKFDAYESKESKESFNDYIAMLKNNRNNMNRIIDLISAKGVKTLFTFSARVDISLDKESRIAGGAVQEAYENAIDELLHVTRISRASDYLYGREYFYNSHYHLNNKGTEMRSEQLARDLLNYLRASA